MRVARYTAIPGTQDHPMVLAENRSLKCCPVHPGKLRVGLLCPIIRALQPCGQLANLHVWARAYGLLESALGAGSQTSTLAALARSRQGWVCKKMKITTSGYTDSGTFYYGVPGIHLEKGHSHHQSPTKN